MMDWVFELTCSGDATRFGDAIAWANRAASCWTSLPALASLDLYAPVTDGAHDPFNNDGPGPLFIAMLAFGSRDALERAVTSPELALSLGGRPASLAWAGSSLERHFYPVGGASAPAPLSAPFSYVVRYHKPAEDEAAFIRNYVDTHPPTLGKLPGIRSVMCYFPQAAAAQGVQGADYIIGNEVAFDSIAAFNAAMQSEVRQELRAHYRDFPRFTGLNTHFPMSRTRLVG
jgi:uncharacterized protein (TIGR02118 family)